MAAIVGSNLTAGVISTSGSSSFTTASVTPAANSLVLLSIRSVDPPTSVSGCGLTWSAVDNVTGPFVWKGIGTPSAGTITANFPAGQFRLVWSVDQFTNVDYNNPVQQTTNNTGTGTSLTVTLAAFASADNATFGTFRHAANEATTPGTGFTELSDDGANQYHLQTEWRADNDTTVTASWATSSVAYGVAVEIRNASLMTSNTSDFFFG